MRSVIYKILVGDFEPPRKRWRSEDFFIKIQLMHSL